MTFMEQMDNSSNLFMEKRRTNYLIIFTMASRNALSPAGGDDPLVFRYAVRRRSVARSSTEARLAVVGTVVCEAEELIVRGSVVNLCVHYT